MIQSLIQRCYGSFWGVFNTVRLLCGSVPRGWAGARWFILALHYAAVAVAFGLLAYFSDRVAPPESLEVPIGLVRRWWLGFIFLLLYLAVRLTIYIVLTLRGGTESEWPELERDFDDLVGALERDGIDLGTVPIVVVTGLDPSAEKTFFEAGGIPWKTVAPDPSEGSDTQIRAYATGDGIFLSCPRISALTAQASIAATGAANPISRPVVSAGGGPAGDPTMRPGQIAAAVAAAPTDDGGTAKPGAIAAGVRAEAGGESGGVGQTLRSVASLLQRTLTPAALRSAAPRGEGGGGTEATLLTGTERDRYASQMRFLGTLIRRERPHCAINGALEIVPIQWTDYPRQWKGLAASALTDREALSETTLLTVPTLLGFGGLDRLPAFPAVIERFAQLGGDQLRHTRAGTRLPGCGSLSETDSKYAADQIVEWFRGWIFSAFADDLTHGRNAELYRFLCALDSRRIALARLIDELYPERRGDRTSEGGRHEAGRLFGAYAFATGRAIDSRAFVSGLLQRALQIQNEPLVPPAVIAKDRRLTRAASGLFAAAALLLALGGWMMWRIFAAAGDNLTPGEVTEASPAAGEAIAVAVGEDGRG